MRLPRGFAASRMEPALACATHRVIHSETGGVVVRRKFSFRKNAGESSVGIDVPVQASDYQIYATYRRTPSGAFMGDLKVVRMIDDRLIFPFDGAPPIGPFDTASEARDSARAKGAEIVAADLANPEA
ncbi:UNVERIFIED_ORG: hypothetical protein ABIC54_005087 [Burkholderia sp. 1263]